MLHAEKNYGRREREHRSMSTPSPKYATAHNHSLFSPPVLVATFFPHNPLGYFRCFYSYLYIVYPFSCFLARIPFRLLPSYLLLIFFLSVTSSQERRRAFFAFLRRIIREHFFLSWLTTKRTTSDRLEPARDRPSLDRLSLILGSLSRCQLGRMRCQPADNTRGQG